MTESGVISWKKLIESEKRSVDQFICKERICLQRTAK